MSRPRLLFINRSYWPDSEATGQLLTDLCQDLSGDFDVSVLVGLPNHVAEGQTRPMAGRSNHAGVDIIRVRHTQFAKHAFWGRVINLVTFTLAAFWRAMWLPTRPDVVITETDPFFLPLVGRILKWRYGCRFVAYLQDIYPDVAVAVGKVREGLITRCLRWLLVSAYRRADRVIVLSDDMRNLVVRNGVPESKVCVVPNWIDTSLIRPRTGSNPFREQHACDDHFVVMYSGNMGMGHLLDPLIEAADALRAESTIQFMLIGEGQQKDRLSAEVSRRDLRNVRFFPYQPRESLTHSLSAADCHVISIRPEVVECLMPSKLYGVLAAGVPAIVLAPQGCELAQLIETEEAGIVCTTDDPVTLGNRIAAAILRLYHAPELQQRAGHSARQLAERDYDRYQVTHRFGLLLKSLIET